MSQRLAFVVFTKAKGAPVRGQPENGSALRRLDVLLAGLLVCLVLAAGQAYIVPAAAGAYHDDGIYLATAKALAEGQGYRLINLPGMPPQTKYPILYPAILAAAWTVWPQFPDNLVVLKDVSLACCALAVGLTYLFVVRFGYAARAGAVAGCLLAATSPLFLYYGGLTMSEPPFAVLLLASLWTLESAFRQPAPAKPFKLFLLGLAAGLPFLCRTNGLMLAVAGAVVLWKRGRPPVLYCLGVAAVVLGWGAWALPGKSALADAAGLAYYTDYVGWWADFGPRLLGRIATLNFLSLLQMSAVLPLPGLTDFLEATFPSLIAAAAATLGGALLLFSLLRQACRRQVLPLALVAYFSLLIVWPWPVYRFLIPILPFLAVFLVAASGRLLRRFAGFPAARLMGAGIMAVLLVWNLQLVRRSGQSTQERMYPLFTAESAAPAWSSYQELFQWIKAHSADSDILAAGLDTMVYLYTGRQAYRPFVSNPLALFYDAPGLPLGGEDAFLTRLRAMKPRYLLRMPMVYFGEEKPFNALLDKIESAPNPVLRQVWVGQDSRFAIYEPDYGELENELSRRGETAGAGNPSP